ncbi:MAG: hypothetical protein WA431_12360 [Candidatus Cybelea sp.]
MKRRVAPGHVALLTMTACSGGSTPLLGHFPTVALYGRSPIGFVLTSIPGPAAAGPAMSTH